MDYPKTLFKSRLVIVKDLGLTLSVIFPWKDGNPRHYFAKTREDLIAAYGRVPAGITIDRYGLRWYHWPKVCAVLFRVLIF